MISKTALSSGCNYRVLSARQNDDDVDTLADDGA
jgi:hypothetical protein